MTHAQMNEAVRASANLSESSAERHGTYAVRASAAAAAALERFPALGSKADNEKRAA